MIASIVGKNGTITVYVNGKSHVFAKDHVNYNRVKSLLTQKGNGIEAELERLMDIPATVQALTKGYARVLNGKVYFNNGEMHNELTRRILEHTSSGLPFEPMLRFLENIMLNPDERCRQELYSFLEKGQLPITEDGFFIGYRSVRPNFTDWHTGKFDNSVGKKPYMDRKDCDANSGVACSQGFHIGTLNYAKNFKNIDGRQIIIVKVNPKDIVSVCSDASAEKIRANTFEVLKVYGEPLTETVYNDRAEKYQAKTEVKWEEPVVAKVQPEKVKRLYKVSDKLQRESPGPIYFWEETDVAGQFRPLSKDKKEYSTNIRYNVNQINLWLESNQIELVQNEYGVKPDGTRYYNHRVGGKFAKRN